MQHNKAKLTAQYQSTLLTRRLQHAEHLNADISVELQRLKTQLIVSNLTASEQGMEIDGLVRENKVLCRIIWVVAVLEVVALLTKVLV